jgi:hypothetical protein
MAESARSPPPAGRPASIGQADIEKALAIGRGGIVRALDIGPAAVEVGHFIIVAQKHSSRKALFFQCA